MYKRLVPVLLIEGERTVKTINFKDGRYLGSPLNIVRIFNAKEVDEIIVLDISATKKHRGPNFELIKALADECSIPCAYGGGIRTLEDASKIFSFGYDKIVMQSSFFDNPEFISKVASLRGAQAVSLSLDVIRDQSGDFKLFNYINREIRDLDLITEVTTAINLGCGEIIVNSVDRDGCMNGLDIELVKYIKKFCKVPLTILGGLASFEDAKLAIEHGADAVGGGSFFSYKSKTKGILISYPKTPLTNAQLK
ncbi:unannotated protein [freshwater metagenome]|uniref:imidazole glycerol-phosphate synthase n=1 Tax=freshwater metagenome TaxID=449393 RepID=A0A6J6E5W9_9ZZZZ